MKFSVIIPCYHSEHTIKRAIQSCLDQSYRDFEIIAVDDASQDQTLVKLQECQKLCEAQGIQLRIERQAKNQGPSATRNRGWDLAQGQFVAFLDGDDVWHPQKLAQVAKLLESRPTIDGLGHAHTVYSGPQNLKLNINLIDSNCLKKITTGQLLRRNLMVTPSVVLRTAITERFDETMHYCEDHDLWLRLTFKYQLYFWPEVLVFIGRPVLAAGGQSASHWKMRRGEMALYNKAAKSHLIILPLLPFLLCFSLLKHIRLKILLLFK